MFEKDKGQHILKNPLIINAMIEKVSCIARTELWYRVVNFTGSLLHTHLCLYIWTPFTQYCLCSLPCVQQIQYWRWGQELGT